MVNYFPLDSIEPEVLWGYENDIEKEWEMGLF
jgi:hypothetical protein